MSWCRHAIGDRGDKIGVGMNRARGRAENHNLNCTMFARLPKPRTLSRRLPGSAGGLGGRRQGAPSAPLDHVPRPPFPGRKGFLILPSGRNVQEDSGLHHA